MNFERLTQELLTVLRGPRRSRPGFSRHLGYRSNVAQRWETGDCAPTATQFFVICERLRFDVNERIATFLRDEPEGLGRHPLSDPKGLSLFLEEVRGKSKLGDIAQRVGRNRFSVSRWFRGNTTPRLPDLLALLEACTGRSLDFIGTFVELEALPSARHRAVRLRRARELAYEHPLAHAVLRALGPNSPVSTLSNFRAKRRWLLVSN
jgi:transcriptional regulator with XRE-family HTH domain